MLSCRERRDLDLGRVNPILVADSATQIGLTSHDFTVTIEPFQEHLGQALRRNSLLLVSLKRSGGRPRDELDLEELRDARETD